MAEAMISRERIHEDNPAWMGWRDAITPVTRVSRRRWVLFYPAVLVIAAAQAGWGERLGIVDGESSTPGLIAVVLLFIVFGMLRRSTRRLTAMDHPDLDERDQLARAVAFRVAYPLFLLVLVGTIVALYFALPDVSRELSREVTANSIGVERESGSLLTGEALIGIGLWVALWAVFLPTATLAWAEPDSLDDTRPAGGPSELVRDLILAVGFTAALALELISPDGGGSVLTLLLVLCLMAAWVRRGAGQQAVGRHIGGVGILCVSAGLFVPLVAIFDSGGSAGIAGWLLSIALLALGTGILVTERRERRI